MLMPKRVKFRKQFRGSMAGTPTRGTKIAYGEYGLVCTEPVWIRSRRVFSCSGVPVCSQNTKAAPAPLKTPNSPGYPARLNTPKAAFAFISHFKAYTAAFNA